MKPPTGTKGEVHEARTPSRRGRLVRHLVPRLALLGLAVGLILGLMVRSPTLALTTVNVRGLDRLKREDIISAAALLEGQSMLRLDLDQIARRLLGLPRVAVVRVDRVWPRTLDIVIQERAGLMLVACGTGWLEVAADGVIIEIHEALELVHEGLFELTGFAPAQVALGARLPGPDGFAAAASLAVLAEAGEEIVLAAVDDGMLEVHLADLTTIYLGRSGSDLPHRARIALAILYELRATAQQVEYIDVRVPTQPVVKPR